MKKLLILLILTTGLTGFSQETKATEKKPERMKVVKGGEPEKVQATNTTKKLSPEEELKSCEAQLEAINKKEAYLNSHPKDLKVAKEHGWFKDAEKNKAILTKRINELKIELKK
ncbi:hypothetical protein N8987_01765 [Crocinitomix sp.]|nr:hypothetical protein [Crocinitomix sp.]